MICKVCGAPTEPSVDYCSIKCVRDKQKSDPPYFKTFLEEREQIRRRPRRADQ